MFGRPPINPQRMDELCALRRSLTDAEITEVKRLRIALYNADYKRRRYAEDPAFRATSRSRSDEWRARRREERGHW